MTETILPQLGDDQPKQNPWEQDRLGFAAFCGRVAETLIRLRAPGGYVVGLNGKWGSGKSTALNFIKSYIAKHNEETVNNIDKIIVVDFRPWMISGHQDVIANFFKVLAESLGDPAPWYKRWLRWLCRLFKSSADPLIDAVAKVGATVDPSGGTATTAISRGLKGLVSASISRFLAEPSLQKTYENLRAQLTADGRRFVVTIDDLDRLQDDEVVAILQMVKTVGRLPNIIYILIYDQQIVGNALAKSARQGSAPNFIEKIVQQELELPQPGRARLLAMLDQEISFIAAQIPENERWSTIVMDGIYHWVRRPRDIVRLANALIFAWPSLENEIDAADLIAMEGLRIFEPAAFSWVRENRDFFFSEGRFTLAQDEVLLEAVASLKKEIADARHKSAMSLLSTLFPQRLKAFKGSDAFGSGESYADQVTRRGIATPQGYDAYFSLHVSSDRISNASMRAFVAAIDNEPAIEAAIQGYLSKKTATGELIGEFIEELQMRFRSRKRPNSTGALLNVLVRNGEAILSKNENTGFFRLSAASRFGFLIDDILDGWSIEEAGEHLLQAFKQESAPPSALADIYVDRGRELDIFERGGRTSDGPRISSETFAKLGEVVRSRIVEAANDGSLTNAPFYYDIIRAWSHLSGPEAPRMWVETHMQANPQFLIKLGRGLVSHTIGERRRSYSMRERPNTEIYDLNLIRAAALEHIGQTALSDDDRALLTELATGAERFLAGAPAPPFPEDDE